MEEIDEDEWYLLEEELKSYAELEGCSLGDYCTALLYINSIIRNGSDEFIEAYTKELKRLLNDFKDNFTVEKETETFTRVTHYLKPKK